MPEVRHRLRADALLPEPPPPTTVFVDTSTALRTACAALASCDVFGVDMEMTSLRAPGGRLLPPALLQVAGMAIVGDTLLYAPVSSGEVEVVRACGVTVYIFDLLRLLPEDAGLFSEGFKEILASPRKLLLGVGIENDLIRLVRSYGRDAACFAEPVSGVLDIGLVKGAGRKLSLKEVTARFARRLLSKETGKGSWARRPLGMAQVTYAANDALAALLVYASAGAGPFEPAKNDLCVGEKKVWMCKVCGTKALSMWRLDCQERCGRRTKGLRGQGNLQKVLPELELIKLPGYSQELIELDEDFSKQKKKREKLKKKNKRKKEKTASDAKAAAKTVEKLTAEKRRLKTALATAKVAVRKANAEIAGVKAAVQKLSIRTARLERVISRQEVKLMEKEREKDPDRLKREHSNNYASRTTKKYGDARTGLSEAEALVGSAVVQCLLCYYRYHRRRGEL